MSQTLLKPTPALPPIKVERVPLFNGGGTLVPRQPLLLEVVMSPCEKYFETDYEAFTISANEKTYDELVFTVHEQLALVWESFVEDTATPLTEDAQVLRGDLKKFFELKK